jgi:hypothetical protein
MKQNSSAVGMTKAEAIKYFESRGVKVRIMSEEGNSFFGTADVQHTRANLTIEGGKVTKVSYG